MLDLEHVHWHYGKSHVLRDVSLRVEPGEIVSVIGPNAAGKTTSAVSDVFIRCSWV